MNEPIVRLFGFCCLLFAFLVLATTRWTALEDERLRAHPGNPRDELRAQSKPRGRIRAGDGSLLAGTRRTADGLRRRYPFGAAFAHPVGYASGRLGETGLERAYRDQVRAGADFDGLLGLLGVRDRAAQDLATSLRPAAQRAALEGLRGHAGAVVALEPTTGRVLAWASTPSFEPEAVVAASRPPSLDGGAYVDRPSRALYPPGSTFKIVTTAAALDAGVARPDTVLDGNSPRLVSGAQLANSGDASLGPIPLSTAVTRSVNTAFAQLAGRIGGDRLDRYMRRFGLGEPPDVDLPTPRVSGIYGSRGRLLAAADPAVDLGRVAIGQERLLASPLQMAQVAAAVANDGILMPARIVDRVAGRSIRDGDGRRVIRPASARTLQRLLSDVVREGTGTAATLAGTTVAGKTGTAEVDIASGINDLWFVGFAPARRPKVAVAVIVERQQGLAGTIAAPIARDVIAAALESRK